MTATDLSRRFEERYPNGRFRIRKRTFGQAAANDRSWPKADIAYEEIIVRSNSQ